MTVAEGIVSVLAGALPTALDLARRELAGEDVKAEAEQLAANTAYKLGAQQVHLTHAEQVIPGFKR